MATASDLNEGDQVYSNELDEVLTVKDINSQGSITWDDGVTETPTSVNAKLDDGTYEIQ